jgi:uncharacterized repeat protein (TIGR03803 family)
MRKIITFLSLIFILQLHAQQYTKLFEFNDTLGAFPKGDLLYDSTYLYGMTEYGGTKNIGTIFKIKIDGTGFQVMHNFNDTNGAYPHGSLIVVGNYLYGMANLGGTHGYGLIFKIKPDGTGYDTVLNFTGVNGSNPYGALLYYNNYLYGTTSNGNSTQGGYIFKIKPDGTSYQKLFDFYGYGFYPKGNLITYGNYLYGIVTDASFGTQDYIIKIDTSGAGYTQVYQSTLYCDNTEYYGSLLYDGTNMYGMFNSLANNEVGNCFRIKPDGTGYTDLFDFSGVIGDANSSLITDGTWYYGMVTGRSHLGVIFKLKPLQYSSTFNVLYSFSNDTNGILPFGSLVSDGYNLYGMTSQGGKYGYGVVFRYCLTNPCHATSISEQSPSIPRIYPNPTSDMLHVEGRIINTKLEITDILGNKLIESNLQQGKATIDVSSLSNGVYFIKTKEGIQKFIKQ